MTARMRTERVSAPTAFGALSLLYAATFFLGAVLHLGVTVPLGVGVLSEPVIPPATVVESLCGLALTVAGVAILTGRRWWWRASVAAHAFALGGVLLGIIAVAAPGRGPSTPLNNAYHLTMVVALTGTLVALARSRRRSEPDRGVDRGPESLSGTP